MEASEITEIIEREIGGNWSLSNAHRVDLRRCLVEPAKRVYENSFQPGEMIELWVVLEEVPGDQSGYKIVFDEGDRIFGLAASNIGDSPDVFLGYYGSFIATLEAM